MQLHSVTLTPRMCFKCQYDGKQTSSWNFVRAFSYSSMFPLTNTTWSVMWVLSTVAFTLLLWHSSEASGGKTWKLYAQSPLSPLWKPVAHAEFPQASFFPHWCSSCVDRLLKTVCYRHGQLWAVFIDPVLDWQLQSFRTQIAVNRQNILLYFSHRLGLEQPTAHMQSCENILFSSVPLQQEVWAWEWAGLWCVAERHNHHSRADKIVALKRLKKTTYTEYTMTLFVCAGEKRKLFTLVVKVPL